MYRLANATRVIKSLTKQTQVSVLLNAQVPERVAHNKKARRI
jgi:hypothetical protein